MQIELDIVWAVIAGGGTVLGTIVMAEKYFASKFKGAVDVVIQSYEFERKIRHTNRALTELSGTVSRIQEQMTDLESRLDDKIYREGAKMQQAFNAINAMRLRHEKLETAARVMGSKLVGDPSITAILAERSEG